MRIKNLLLAAAAIGMTASPVLAANPPAKLSVAPSAARASAAKGEAQFGGTGLIVAAVIAVVVAVVLIADGGSDSP